MLNNIQDISSNNNATSNTLPHSVEAEEALLGSILIDNEVYNRITFDIPLKTSPSRAP